MSKLLLEAGAFDSQIRQRLEGGHIPDLRRSGRCEYFFNNVWRDQNFAEMYFGEVVKTVLDDIRTYLPKQEAVRILEVGCGPGHVSLELARNGSDVTGLDLSPDCVKLATAVSEQDPWAESRGDLQYIAEDFFSHRGTYDVILFTASLHHFPDCQATLQHAFGLLQDGGLCIADEPLRDLVSWRNAAFITLLHGVLQATGAFYQEGTLPQNSAEVEETIQKIYAREKYESEDGQKLQSVNDNESGYVEISAAFASRFDVLVEKLDCCFFHQTIGGLRLATPEKEVELAAFLKTMDRILCSAGALDPTNCHWVGKKRDTHGS